MRGERLGVVRVSRVGVCGALVEGRFLRGDIELVDGVITRVGMDASGSDSVGTAIAVPGMVDLQVNGAVGVDLRDADRDGYGVVGAFLAMVKVDLGLPLCRQDIERLQATVANVDAGLVQRQQLRTRCANATVVANANGQAQAAHGVLDG